MTTTLRVVDDRDGTTRGFQGMIGVHSSMLRLCEDIRHAARLDLPIVIQGPTGSGKELVAKALHALSERPGRLVAVNVGAIPEQLAESKLFGSTRGAFTGAVSDRRGVIEAASGGTLFLDEAAELSLATQVRLLRSLESGSVRPVGSSTDREVDFRLVLSLQRSPIELVEERRWREDFFYRVAGIVLVVPSLAERPTDLAALASHWLVKLGFPPLPSDAWQELQQHHWPGNVRELRRAVERAVFSSRGQRVSSSEILAAARGSSSPEQGVRTSMGLREIERKHIERVLEDSGHDTKVAAALLGLTRGQLYRRYHALGIVPPRKS